MTLPPTAKKVFAGALFDVYQWEQKLFDGSTTTFEMLKRADSVQIIVSDGKSMIIAAEEQPVKGSFLSLFGGRVEEGEDPLVAAKRELLEESGLVSDDWELYECVQPYSKIDWRIHTFIARNCSVAGVQTLDPGEKIMIKYITFNEFVSLVTTMRINHPSLAIAFLQARLDGSIDNFQKRFGC